MKHGTEATNVVAIITSIILSVEDAKLTNFGVICCPKNVSEKKMTTACNRFTTNKHNQLLFIYLIIHNMMWDKYWDIYTSSASFRFFLNFGQQLGFLTVFNVHFKMMALILVHYGHS